MVGNVATINSNNPIASFQLHHWSFLTCMTFLLYLFLYRKWQAALYVALTDVHNIMDVYFVFLSLHNCYAIIKNMIWCFTIIVVSFKLYLYIYSYYFIAYVWMYFMYFMCRCIFMCVCMYAACALHNSQYPTWCHFSVNFYRLISVFMLCNLH